MTLRITARQQRVASLGGFRDALDRHRAAEGLRPSFVTLSEALWWLTAIEDDLVHNVPTYYADRDASSEAAGLPGLRYARNVSTHQVVALTEPGSGGMTYPYPIPYIIPSERAFWLPFEELPEPDKTSKYAPVQQESYRQHLAGQLTGDTIDRAGR